MSTDPEHQRGRTPDITASQTVKLAAVQTTRFDEYTIIGKLGHGGMAEVFLALEEGVGGFRKLIVIKRLHRHLSEEPEMVQMFLDEARLAARLNHPNVVQTNKIGSFQSQHFMAMEYLEGQPLSKVIKRLARMDRTLPNPLVARVISDALDGLHYAHEAKDFDGSPLRIIHRDISPQNVFVTYDGAVTLLAFGIAKAATQEAFTRTGLVKGKFAYIAPEQADGRNVDRRADVWSMGVVLWETLTGRRLFKADNELATLNETLTKRIPLATELEPSVPPELAHVAARALSRKLDERFSDARAFKEELDEWMASTSRGSSRTSLSTFMKELFADTIEEQRRLIRECVAHVEASRVAMLSGEASGESDSTRVERKEVTSTGMTPGLPPVVSSQEDPHRLRRRGLITVGVIAAVILLAVVAALVLPLGRDDLPELESGVPPADGTPAIREIEDPLPPRPPEPPAAEPAVAAGDPDEAAVPPEAPPPEAHPAAPPPARVPARRAPGHPLPARRDRPAGEAPPGESAQQGGSATNVATGRLSLDTRPWSVVYLAGRRLGHTPLLGVEVPAGTHELHLVNEEQGIDTTYRVTVPPGQTASSRIMLE
ncbi:MAG: protein kinase [Sandaracinaceae bacterium]